MRKRETKNVPCLKVKFTLSISHMKPETCSFECYIMSQEVMMFRWIQEHVSVTADLLDKALRQCHHGTHNKGPLHCPGSAVNCIRKLISNKQNQTHVTDEPLQK